MRGWGRPAAVFLLVCAAIIAPFFLWDEPLTAAARLWLTDERHAATVAAAVILLLMADIVAPVPSSLVATAAGALLGPIAGAIAAAVGLTLGSGLAFVLLRAWCGPYAPAIFGDSHRRLEAIAARHGPAIIAVLRPVPVLAEASVVAAAISRAPLAPSLVAMALSNLGFGAAYAVLGSTITGPGSFLIVFVAATALPAIAWLAWRMVRARL